MDKEKDRVVIERVLKTVDYKGRVTLTPEMVKRTIYAPEYNKVEVTLYDDGVIEIKCNPERGR